MITIALSEVHFMLYFLNRFTISQLSNCFLESGCKHEIGGLLDSSTLAM